MPTSLGLISIQFQFNSDLVLNYLPLILWARSNPELTFNLEALSPVSYLSHTNTIPIQVTPPISVVLKKVSFDCQLLTIVFHSHFLQHSYVPYGTVKNKTETNNSTTNYECQSTKNYTATAGYVYRIQFPSILSISDTVAPISART